MLLCLTASNYKSFRDQFMFSMEAAPKQRELSYSLLREKIGRRMHKAVSVGIVYGPNASGKTNIISAAETLRAIVLRGNIRNTEEPLWSANRAISELELIPHVKSDGKAPTELGITFIDNGFKIEYKLALDLGRFLERDHARRVLREWMCVNDLALFERTPEDVEWAEFNSLPRKIKSHVDRITLQDTGLRDALRRIVKPDSLLLSDASAVLGSFFPDLVQSWFRKKLIVRYASQKLNVLIPPAECADVASNGFAASAEANAAAQRLGMSGEAIGCQIKDGVVDPSLYSMVRKKSGDIEFVRAEDFESYGTVRFAHAFEAAKTAIARGATLMMDEFDASLHPTAVQALIRAFHNDEVNPNKAQLIFNTHNPVYMNKFLCRRDELKFVEKASIEDGSEHWSLADFGTAGEQGVRRVDDYLRDYMKGCYGAINYLQLEDVLHDRKLRVQGCTS